MNIHLQATGVELTDDLKRYVNEKISELEKFIQHPTSEITVWVNVGKVSGHHEHGNVFQVTVDFHMPGHSARAEATGIDVQAAVVQVKDELQQEIKKYKGKMVSKRQKGFRLFKDWRNKN